VVVHIFNPSTWEAEAGRFLSSRPPGLQSEFQDSQGYMEKPCLEKPKKKKKKEKMPLTAGSHGGISPTEVPFSVITPACVKLTQNQPVHIFFFFFNLYRAMKACNHNSLGTEVEGSEVKAIPGYTVSLRQPGPCKMLSQKQNNKTTHANLTKLWWCVK
jgi:hypothetical protein